jgi:hypothetical protein
MTRILQPQQVRREKDNDQRYHVRRSGGSGVLPVPAREATGRRDRQLPPAAAGAEVIAYGGGGEEAGAQERDGNAHPKHSRVSNNSRGPRCTTVARGNRGVGAAVATGKRKWPLTWDLEEKGMSKRYG